MSGRLSGIPQELAGKICEGTEDEAVEVIGELAKANRDNIPEHHKEGFDDWLKALKGE